MRHLAAIALVFAFTACDTTTPPDYDDLKGSYSGTIQGSGNGISYFGNATVAITQSDGHLSGTWTVNAKASDGVIVVNFSGSAKFDGTVTEGRNPRVSLNFVHPQCGGSVTFSGRHTTQSGQIQLSGQDTIMDGACQPWATLNVTVSLN